MSQRAWTLFEEQADGLRGWFRVAGADQQVNAKAIADPRLAAWNANNMPFDGKRMFWGGFKPFLSL